MDATGNGVTYNDGLPSPAVKAALRLTQLYHSTGDGTTSGSWVIVAGRLLLIVNGRTEDLGAWEGGAAPAPTSSPAPS